MTINVTCPSCLTRFTVNEKYAGKSGPCPKCKATIKIPSKSDEVVIHAPKDDSPKDAKGRSVFLPVRRQEVKLSLPIILVATLGAIVVLTVAIGLGVNRIPPHSMLLAGASLLLAIPIVIAGYWFFQNDELQGFRGQEMWVRCMIVASLFAATWAIYTFIPAVIGSHDLVSETTSIEMAFLILAMIVVGTATAVLSLELEIGQAVMLYMLYFIITFVLAWLSGAPLSEFIPGTPRSPSGNSSPSIQQPAMPGQDSSVLPKTLPKLLQ